MEILILLTGFSLSVVLISLIRTPDHFWRVLGSYHLYMVWMVYGALFLKRDKFFWAALAAVPAFLISHYFFFYFPNGPLTSWLRYAVPPTLDMLAIFGLLFIYYTQTKDKQISLKTKQTRSEKRSEVLHRELQKQRIKSENLERLIRNQEYTFSLVYKIFRSFLTSRPDFTRALYQSVSRITRAQELVIFRVEDHTLIPEKAKEAGQKKAISLESNPFLKRISEGERIFSIADISKNDALFSEWKKASHRGLIYIPIREAGQAKYLISVDKMPFALLHQRTLQALNYIRKMAELALAVTREVQESRDRKRPLWQQIIQSPYDFLSLVESEFRRARRFQSSFSLIAIRTQTGVPDLSVAELTQSIQTEIRELDQIYVDKPRSLIWIILPFTGFYEMSGILNRLNKRLNYLAGPDNEKRKFDYGFSVFEPDYESSKVMMKQVLEVLQIHAKILEKMSRRHAPGKTVYSS
ncbi:MAG: hypothetical protein GXO76_00925 [Calditrichaeota bacterium]|nr:hypothetical protein [Calditrichota bacterium]